MTEFKPPPLPSPASPKLWWFVWVLCTVILPPIIGALGSGVISVSGPQGFFGVSVVAALAGLALHVVSCVKLSEGSSGWRNAVLMLGLLLGGWVLMLALMQFGCHSALGR